MASQALANDMKVGYTRMWLNEKGPQTSKIGICLANHLAKPPLEPCEARRSGKDVEDA